MAFPERPQVSAPTPKPTVAFEVVYYGEIHTHQGMVDLEPFDIIVADKVGVYVYAPARRFR